MRISNTLKADAILVVVTFLAAAGWLFSKETLATMPPLLFIGIRFLLAGATLFLLGKDSIGQLQTRHWKEAMGIGVLFGFAMMLWVFGLFYGTHVGEGAFICSLGVVMVPVTAALFFREKPGAATWWALPVAVAGLACLSLNQGLTLSLGQVLFALSACVFSVQFNFNTLAVARIPAVILTATQLTMVGFMSLVTSAIVETWPDAIDAATWGWVLASALISTSLRFFLQTYAQGFASASHAAVIMVLEPVWASLIGFFWFEEHMSGLQFMGCLLIFAALLINRWRVIQQLLRGHGP